MLCDVNKINTSDLTQFSDCKVMLYTQIFLASDKASV